ncbi:MAG: hypothetical protein HUK40_20915 [Desulfobacter sp.]|nr:hypothetical protein [Desulfobacter sp.]
MEEEKNKAFFLKERIVRLKLFDGTLINGQVNISRNHGYERLSDFISDKKDPFLVVFNATLYDKTIENSEKNKTLFVNKTHILWVEPDEEQK